jgi:hypothetical protein
VTRSPTLLRLAAALQARRAVWQPKGLCSGFAQPVRRRTMLMLMLMLMLLAFAPSAGPLV